MKRAILLLSLFCLLTTVQAQDVVYGALYGVIPDTGNDMTQPFQNLLQAVKTRESVTIILSAGQYDFYEENAIHKEYYESNTTNRNPKNLAILFEDMHNVTVDGNFSTLMFHGKMQPITLDRCTNISIRNIIIDFATPTSVEAEVVHVDSSYFEIAFDPQLFPYVVDAKQQLHFFIGKHKTSPFTYVEFNHNSRMVEPYTGDRGWWEGIPVDEVEKGRLRIFYPNKAHFPKLHNWIVIRHGERNHAGIFIQNSADVLVQNVNIYQTDGLAILAQFTHNLNLFSCSVVPNYLIGRKYISSHDDGFHLMGCSGQIRVENCEWYGLMDDAINIHGTYVKVVKRKKNRVIAQFMHHETTGLEWGRMGEKIYFVDPKTMKTIDSSTIIEYNQLNRDQFELVLDTSPSRKVKSKVMIENVTCNPDVKISNCRFRSGRARGLLISTRGNVRIEDNIFESAGSAILIAGDAREWYESGPVRDVTIRKNIFRYSCNSSPYQFSEAVISIYPNIAKPDPEHPYHANIRIEDNSFFLFDYPILFAKSVDGLTFKNNILYRSKGLEPFHPNQFGYKLIACKKVTIGPNKTEGEILGKSIIMEQMNAKELHKE